MVSLANIDLGSGGGVVSSAGEQKGAGVSFLTTSASFEVPCPPSVNAMYKNVPGVGRVKTRDYELWKREATTSLHRAGLITDGRALEAIETPVIALIGVERSAQMKRADIDNREKALLDLAVSTGIIADDHLVTAVFAFWLPACNGMAHVRFMKAETVTMTFHVSHDGASGAVVTHDAPQPQMESNDGLIAI